MSSAAADEKTSIYAVKGLRLGFDATHHLNAIDTFSKLYKNLTKYYLIMDRTRPSMHFYEKNPLIY